MAAAAVAAAAAALTLLGAATSQKAAFNLYLERHESRRLFGEPPQLEHPAQLRCDTSVNVG